MMIDSVETFFDLVKRKVIGEASDKGYGTSDEQKMWSLDEAETVAPGCGHALGEIKYKVNRYSKKRNPDDLVKIAAWAFLIWWKEHNENQTIGLGDRIPTGSLDLPDDGKREITDTDEGIREECRGMANRPRFRDDSQS